MTRRAQVAEGTTLGLRVCGSTLTILPILALFRAIFLSLFVGFLTLFGLFFLMLGLTV